MRRASSIARSRESPATVIFNASSLSSSSCGLIETRCTRAASPFPGFPAPASRKTLYARSIHSGTATRRAWCGSADGSEIPRHCRASWSRSAIMARFSAMAARSRRALIQPVYRASAGQASAARARPRPVPQRIQNCRASSYGWLARLISKRINQWSVVSAQWPVSFLATDH